MLTLGELLDDPLLGGVDVLAAADAATEREVRWFSVIEGPVEDFVQRGDVVMTTGLGCDADRFVLLVEQVVASDPAGLFIALPQQSELSSIPKRALGVAEAASVPVVELPWRLRFAEIARVIVDRLTLAAGAGAAAAVGLSADYIAGLLDERGGDRLAELAEQHVGRPVIALGSDLAVEAVGPQARHDLAAAVASCEQRASALSSTQLLATRAALENAETRGEALERLGLPPAVVVSTGSLRRAGYLLAFATAATDLQASELAERLHAAAPAFAIEQLRARAVAEADVRAHGDLLWAIARGDLTNRKDIIRRAALLGHDCAAEYVVAVGLPESGSAASHAAITLDVVVLRRLRRHGIRASRSEDGVLVLAPLAETRLEQLLADAPGATWGIAEGTVIVPEMRAAYLRARATAVTAVALGREGSVNRQRKMSPYLLLGRLRADADSQSVVSGLLGRLIEYDERTGRDFIGTLEVYLATNCNASAAARELHLNRHSLLYRRRKIEALTGCDLDYHDDRFLLELALRIWRIEYVDRGAQAAVSNPG